MKYFKSLNNLAIIVCILFYLTCYLRFIGQGFLCFVQMITAIFLTFEIFSKKIVTFKKNIKIYWLISLSNLALLIAFFHFIMWNDFLQFIFVTLLPNIMAIYFFRLLNKFIEYEKIPNEYKLKTNLL